MASLRSTLLKMLSTKSARYHPARKPFNFYELKTFTVAISQAPQTNLYVSANQEATLCCVTQTD